MRKEQQTSDQQAEEEDRAQEGGSVCKERLKR